MKEAIIDLHYFPNIEYFSILSKLDVVYLEAKENFQKQTYRNRCYILTANKVERLSVPLLGANKGLPIQEMKIDARESWQKQHWRAIQSAYGRSAYFEYYADMIKEVLLGKEYTHLFELNYEILTFCLKILGVKCQIRLTEDFTPPQECDILDLRSAIHPKKEFGIINVQPYQQVFGEGFAPNLSILDLLFNEGPNASYILRMQESKFLS
ncbi:WbqC family protein [Sediminitomix flava]|uniref:WbqC-like protein n=1 Tax=Sediminitomix flava TaxID=379075 RepID=A0A315ZID2_SEDFL|nr:WbqC family protein [Sediminitomix flava]PWJ44969.1 WbqC-like protein [Sediminitomix flava]